MPPSKKKIRIGLNVKCTTCGGTGAVDRFTTKGRIISDSCRQCSGQGKVPIGTPVSLPFSKKLGDAVRQLGNRPGRDSRDFTLAELLSALGVSRAPGGGSLTWFIKTHNPFWRRVTPDTNNLIIPLNRQLRSHSLEVPLNPENRNMVGPLNTAVDYFCGWMVDDPLSDVLSRTAIFEEAIKLGEFINPLLARLRTNAGRRDAIDNLKNKSLLARIFLIIGQMDSAFRTGNPEYVPSPRGLGRLDPISSPIVKIDSWFKKAVPDTPVNECLAMANRLAKLLPLQKRCKYNPVFGGYGIINGSDGDLFAGDTLYEIKCYSSEKSGFCANDIRQLLGYCVLNKLNRIGLPIRKIGLINPRRSFKWVEDIETVCSTIGARSLINLTKQMRRELKA